MSLLPETVALSARDSLLTVETLFDAILNRNGDAAGLDYWVGQLESGALTVEGVAELMFASQEAHDLYAGSREDNIEALYQQIFGRAYDAEGMAYWMNSDLSLGKIALSFLNSQEAQLHNGKALLGFQAAALNGADFDGSGTLEDFATSPTVMVDIAEISLSPETVALSARDSLLTVETLYDAILNRNGDAAGLDYWVGQLESGALTVEGVAELMFASQEALDLYAGSREESIEALYQQIFGRAYDAEGMAYWMNSDLSLGKIALSFLNSQEALQHNGKALVGFQAAALNGADFDGSGTLEDFATPPTVIVDIVDASLGNTTHSSQVTFEFSKDVMGFDASDLTAVGGKLSDFAKVDGNSYTATFTADDDFEGLGSVTVGTDYNDIADNAGTANSGEVLIDTKSPGVTVNIAISSLNDAVNSSLATFTFSEAVSGFDADDLTAENGTLSDFTKVDDTTYTATFTADDGFEGTGRVTVGADYTDLAGNAGAGGSYDVAIETKNPTVTVDIVDGSLSDTDKSSLVTFEFSEDVTGFDASDLTLIGGKLSDFTKVDGNSYTATFTATKGFLGTGSVSVGTDYADAAGNTGTANSDAVSIDFSYNHDGQATQVHADKGSIWADTLHGTSGDDTMDGLNGGDVIYGGAGTDALKGGDGNDTIFGGSGADKITGGEGADTLYGGTGNDTYIYGNVEQSNAWGGIDKIIDFTQGDLIDVSAIDADTGLFAPGNQAFTFGGTTATAHGVWYEESGGNTLLHFDTGGITGTHEMEIVLTGVGLGLTASDFIL